MNKGLEALKTLVSHRKFGDIKSQWEREECKKTIEKELKALEIIKEKDVDVVALKISISLKQYNCKEDGRCPLTQEEYDLLREVLL